MTASPHASLSECRRWLQTESVCPSTKLEGNATINQQTHLGSQWQPGMLRPLGAVLAETSCGHNLAKQTNGGRPDRQGRARNKIHQKPAPLDPPCPPPRWEVKHGARPAGQIG